MGGRREPILSRGVGGLGPHGPFGALPSGSAPSNLSDAALVELRAGKMPPPAFGAEHHPADAPMAAMAGDLVTSILNRIRITTWVAGLSTASGKWSFSPPGGVGGFHAIVEGRKAIRGEDGVIQDLRAGDLAIVLHGHHTVGDHPDSPHIDLREVIKRDDIKAHRGLRIGSGEPDVRFIGGFIVFDGPAGPRLRSALPQIIIVRGSKQSSDALVPTVIRLLEAQARDATPGTNAVMTQLVTLLFQEAVRHALIESGPSRSGWAKAVLDDHIGPALALIHSTPGKAWTLADMANEAGLSRTVFHERFSALVGMPPAAYLREHRLEVAADLLRNTENAVRDIAKRVGYASQGAFCSAFKRWANQTPVEYREAKGREYASREPHDLPTAPRRM